MNKDLIQCEKENVCFYIISLIENGCNVSVKIMREHWASYLWKYLTDTQIENIINIQLNYK